MIEIHTQDDRLNGICRVCIKDTTNIKKCLGFGSIGDRACDTRHIPGWEQGNKFILCKYHKNYETS